METSCKVCGGAHKTGACTEKPREQGGDTKDTASERAGVEKLMDEMINRVKELETTSDMAALSQLPLRDWSRFAELDGNEMSEEQKNELSTLDEIYKKLDFSDLQELRWSDDEEECKKIKRYDELNSMRNLFSLRKAYYPHWNRDDFRTFLRTLSLVSPYCKSKLRA